MISIEAMLVTLCQLERWENFDNHHPEKLKDSKIQNLKDLQGKHKWRSFVLFKPVFAIPSNFTHNPED